MIKIDKNFCELFGVLMGDGCLSKFRNEQRTRYIIRIDGNKKTDYNYFLTFLKPLIKNVFNRNVSIRFRKNSNVIFIYFSHKEAFYFMHKIGFPIGEKGEIRIPLNLMNLGWMKVKYVIRGLIDTDGCVYFTKNNKDKYYYPAIDLRSKSNTMLKQVHLILKARGFRPYWRDRHLVLYGNYNIEKWLKDVGLKNSNHLSKILYWRKFGECPPGKAFKSQIRK